VLDAIQRRRGISRAELAGVTGLTQAAISKIVADLIAIGLVVEEGQSVSAGGRPPVRLTINAEATYVIGIDLARSGIQGVLVDLNGQIRHRVAVGSRLAEAADVTLERLTILTAELLSWAQTHDRQIAGIGIGAPGPLNARDGVILAPPNFPLWRNVPVRQIMEQRFGLPVWLDNDANAQALAEGRFGAGQGLRSFIYIAVGTGVGAGLVINGTLHRGVHNVEGELGHTTVEAAGPRCSCGNRGCLELYTSAPAVVAMAVAALHRGEHSLISELVGGRLDQITIYTIAQAAHAGDQLALRILEQVAVYLGVGVVNAINLLGPEAVILGREDIQACGELLLGPIRATVAERCFAMAAEQVQIRAAQLGDDAPVIGAACLVLENLFRAPEEVLKRSAAKPVFNVANGDWRTRANVGNGGEGRERTFVSR
jgi:glucokinase-like ROK family protein